MATAFISDLHLSSKEPQIITLFLKFLTKYINHLDALYILGDFFDIWIGDDVLTETDVIIMDALKQATSQGLPIYFMPGNRDFLLGKKFLRATGIKGLKDPYLIDLYGESILLMHGDTLCTQDLTYLKFRKKARNWLFQKIFLLKPAKKRQIIAQNYRANSQKHTATTAMHIMDVTPEEIVRVMEKYKVMTLIHGHTHRPAIHEFLLNNQPAKRIVLHAWHGSGGALICNPNGQKQLVTFSGNP